MSFVLQITLDLVVTSVPKLLMSRRKILFSLAALTALSGFVLALLPPRDEIFIHRGTPESFTTVDRTQFKWTELLLARHQPSHLEIRRLNLCVNQPTTEDRQLILQTSRGGFTNNVIQLYSTGQFIELERLGVVLLRVPQPLETNCLTNLKFNSTLEVTQLEISDSGRSWTSSFDGRYFFSGLKIDKSVMAASPSLEWSVTTFSNGTTNTGIRWFVLLIGALSVFLLLVLTTRRQTGYTARHVFDAGPRILVFVTTLLWMISGQFFLDDGWVLQSGRSMSYSLNVYNLYQGWDVRFPIGWLQYLITGPLSTTFESVLVLRLVPVFAIFAMWLLIERYVSWFDAFTPQSRYLLAITFLVGVMSWWMTLRPEPIVGALLCINLIIGARILESPTVERFLVGSIVAAIAATLHPTGLVVAAPILAACILWYSRQVTSLRSLRGMLVGAIMVANAFFGTIATLLFANRDYPDWRANSSLFAATGQLGWREEITRYLYLFDGDFYDSIVRRLTIFIIFACLTLSLWQPTKKATIYQAFAGLATFLGLLLLLFSPSKWSWHFGSVFPLLAVTLASSVNRLVPRTTGTSSAQRLGILISATTFIFVNAVIWKSGNITSEPLSESVELPRILSSIRELLSTPLILFSLLLLLGGVAVAAAAKKLFDLSQLSIFVVALVFLLPTGFTLGVMTYSGFRTDGWSISKHVINDFSGKYECGVADELTLIDVWSPRTVSIAQTTAMTQRGSFVHEDLRFPIYGSAVAGGQMDLMFKKPASRQVLIYVQTQNSPDDILYFTTSPGEQVDVPDSLEGQFVPLLLTLSEHFDSNFVHLRSSQIGDNFLVSEPLAVGETSLSSLLTAEGFKVNIDPFIAMGFPCAAQTSLSKGLAEIPNLVVGDIPLNGATSPWSELTDVRDTVEQVVQTPGMSFRVSAILPTYQIDLD